MRRGISLMEVVTLGVIATVLALPILTGLSTATHQAASGESYLHAEAIAQRAVQEVLARSWEEMTGKLPAEVELGGVPERDEAIARVHPEYRDAVGGPLSPRGKLTIRAVEEGLVAIEVELTWPVHPRSPALRSFHLLRLRARTEQSLIATHPLSVGQRVPLPDREGP